MTERPAGSRAGPLIAGIFAYAAGASLAGLLIFSNVSFCVDTCARHTNDDAVRLGVFLHLVATPLLTTLVIYWASADATGGVAGAYFLAALVNLGANALAAVALFGVWWVGALAIPIFAILSLASAFATSWVASSALEYGPPPSREPRPASRARPEGAVPLGLPARVAFVPLFSGTW